MDDAEKRIDAVSEQIDKNNKDASLYVQRGELYFDMHEFYNAVEDFSQAIKLDASLDAAWFGRGMAQGRMGFINEGIADLSVYIERNPDDSKALTKRGVRYLWKGDRSNAQADLQKAIRIDPDNAEAHDDLGVVLSQMGDYRQAIEHFTTTTRIDPGYQKAHHNLAMALYITENDLMALASVDRSLALKPDSRGSLLLKSKILTAMGRHAEAKRLEDEAIFLPEANWSESAPIR
jgi:tetratricopeptide (TPR) repeat protein